MEPAGVCKPHQTGARPGAVEAKDGVSAGGGFGRSWSWGFRVRVLATRRPRGHARGLGGVWSGEEGPEREAWDWGRARSGSLRESST